VRVLFRIWRQQGWSVSGWNAIYDTTTTYARSGPPGDIPLNSDGQPIPLLGIQGDQIISIPFFATPRVQTNQALHTQLDQPNVQDISAVSGADMTECFFGCWLDINQPLDQRYPQRIVGGNADGPFTGTLIPIWYFLAAANGTVPIGYSVPIGYFLLAEIAYDPDPIASGADPAWLGDWNSDKLAQRALNLVLAPVPFHFTDSSTSRDQTDITGYAARRRTG
jgi:hypothetical protein